MIGVDLMVTQCLSHEHKALVHVHACSAKAKYGCYFFRILGYTKGTQKFSLSCMSNQLAIFLWVVRCSH